MSVAAAYVAVMRRDLTVYLSYRTRLVSQLLTSLFSLTLFYYVSRLVHVSGFAAPGSYFAFVVVGIAMVGVLYSCFTIPTCCARSWWRAPSTGCCSRPSGRSVG